jgi:hypothetical protein
MGWGSGIRKKPIPESSVVDPEPGSGAFLTSGSRMEKNPDPGSGILDKHHPGSHFGNFLQVFGLKIL